MVEIEDSDDLENWLNEQPEDTRIDVAGLIACRAAMRVVPLLVQALDEDAQTRRASIILPVFRALAAANFSSTWPNPADVVNETAIAVATEAASNATAESRDAANAVVGACSRDAAAAAVAAADAGAYAALSAPDDLWYALSSDAAKLREGIKSNALANLPLWTLPATGGRRSRGATETAPAPDWFSAAWRVLSGQRLVPIDNWSVWTKWFVARLEGHWQKPHSQALERAICEIGDEDWRLGPANVNSLISVLAKKHDPDAQEDATPQGVEVVYLEETGLIGFRLQKISPEEAYRALIETLRDDLEEAKALENQVDGLALVLRKLERAVTRYSDQPWRVHNDCARSVARLIEIPPEERAEMRLNDLVYDLQTAVSDLREMLPNLKPIAKARAEVRLKLPNDDVLDAFQDLIDALGDAGEPELVSELKDHLLTLRNARKQAENDVEDLPDGETRDAAYSEGGLAIRVRNRTNEVAKRADGALEKGAEVAEKVQKIEKAASKIGSAWQKIEPWITGWF